jgi:hypothetical protein
MEFVIPIKIPIIKNGVQIYEEKIYIPSNKLVITFEDKKIINIAKFLFFHGYEHLIDENCNKKNFIEPSFASYLNDIYEESLTFDTAGLPYDFNLEEINKKYNSSLLKSIETLFIFAKLRFQSKEIDVTISLLNKIIDCYLNNNIYKQEILKDVYLIMSHCYGKKKDYDKVIHNIQQAIFFGYSQINFYFQSDFKDYQDKKEMKDIIKSLYEKYPDVNKGYAYLFETKPQGKRKLDKEEDKEVAATLVTMNKRKK